MIENSENLKIGVVGAGSWGTALANLLAHKGIRVDLWTYEEEVRQQILTERENRVFLPGFRLSDKLFPSTDIGRVAADKDFLLTVVPSHLVRAVAGEIAPHISSRTIAISASKGSISTFMPLDASSMLSTLKATCGISRTGPVTGLSGSNRSHSML